MEKDMRDALYSLEDHFDALSQAYRWRALRSLAGVASAFFGLLGDALVEEHPHRPWHLPLTD